MNMQNAKDTFYIALRNRLASTNPARVMTLRSVTRPGIFVEEAEAAVAQQPLDIFILRWTEMKADTQLPSVLTQMTCEILYATAGTQNNAGLDRGRALEEMDYEVMQMIYPYCTRKMNYAVTPAASMETLVFWTEAVFGPVTTLRDRLSRIATVNVFAFQEQGEA
nr:hypothetical protein [Paracidobacterium acidisoli]